VAGGDAITHDDIAGGRILAGRIARDGRFDRPAAFPDVIDERGQFRDDRAIHFVPAAGPRWHAASLDVLHGSAPATCF